MPIFKWDGSKWSDIGTVQKSDASGNWGNITGVYYWDGSNYTQNTSTGIDCVDLDCIGAVNPDNPLQICSLREFELWDHDYCRDSFNNDPRIDSYPDCSDNYFNSTHYSTNVNDPNLQNNTDCWEDCTHSRE